MSKATTARELYGKAIGVGLLGLASLAGEGLLCKPVEGGVKPGGWDLATNKKCFASDNYSSSFSGGVSIAAGDLDGDGLDDMVTATGAGVDSSWVKWNFDAATQSFVATTPVSVDTTPSSAGLRVAVGNVLGTGNDTLSSDATGGGTYVHFEKIKWNDTYDYTQTNGIYVATGDVDGDRQTDVVVGPSTGNASGGKFEVPALKVFDYDSTNGGLNQKTSFAPYDASYTGGIRVAVDKDKDGDPEPAEIVTAQDSVSSPTICTISIDPSTGAASVVSSFVADSYGSTQGVFLAAGDVNGDGRMDVITGAAPGAQPWVDVYSYNPATSTWDDIEHEMVFDPTYLGGVSVAVGDFNGNGSEDILFAPASAVPEPSACALIGAVAWAGLARRRRRSG